MHPASLVLLMALAVGSGAGAAEPPARPTLVVLDSPGQPATELAHEAWRQTRHRSAKVAFRWIRIGEPGGLPGSSAAPGGSPVAARLTAGQPGEGAPTPGAAAPGASPAPPRVGRAAAPPAPAAAGGLGADAAVPPTPDIEPEWDPTGTHAARWDVEGLPRVLLVDPGDTVWFREVFMSTPRLRYLVRHPGSHRRESGVPSRSGRVPGDAKRH